MPAAVGNNEFAGCRSTGSILHHARSCGSETRGFSGMNGNVAEFDAADGDAVAHPLSLEASCPLPNRLHRARLSGDARHGLDDPQQRAAPCLPEVPAPAGLPSAGAG